MPRSYGKIKAEIWNSGSDYRRLPAQAQWAYQMLFSQQSVSMVGALTYMPRKWAKLASDMTIERLEEIIALLEQEWYVLVDRETEELLIRSFIKHDEPWRVGNLLTAARRQFLELESEALRGYLLERHPWLADWSPRESVEAFEQQASEQASERTSQLPFEQSSEQASEQLIPTRTAASPTPTTAPSKGRVVGVGTSGAPAPEGARPPAAVDEESGQIGVRAHCPECGPLHDVGVDFDLDEHRRNIHGVEPEPELGEPVEHEEANAR